MKKITSLFCILVLFLALSACNGSFRSIDAEQVEKMTVWTHEGECELAAEDVEQFITLYHAATFGGKANGEGGTPDFGVSVYFDDEKWLSVNQFSPSGTFEVVVSDSADFYIESEALYSFVNSLIDRYL